MNASRWYILLLVLIAASLRSVWASEASSAEADIDKQIRIYKLLLFSEDQQARKELLDVLADPNNPDARAAVCKALIAAREEKKQPPNNHDFIEPLMAMLSTETDRARSDLMAQALLMFRYESIEGRIEHLITDPNASKTARLNAVRAMMYQPNDRAIFGLVDLLGASDADLAAEAKQALGIIGIDVPSDPNVVQILTDRLESRGPEWFLNNPAIQRIWLVSQKDRIAEQAASSQADKQRYLAVLDRLYIAQSDEAASGEFLTQQLNSADSAVKLWVLGKVGGLRTGTDKGKVSPQLQNALLGLISNQDRRVRLKTAELLTLMSELNAAGQLLERLKVEDDAEVRHGLFVALGTACYYASSTVKVPEDIRKQTLELAVGFLDNADPEKVRSGADVIRKLLEQNGLPPGDIDKYLAALANRYRQGSPAVNHGLRAEVLGAMAGLCGSRSVCRAQAAKLYGPVFEQALADELETVRQAAIDGLSNTDKVAALKKLTPGFINDPSPAVRARVIGLADAVGGSDDLPWLLTKIGKNGEDEPAWQATVKILRRAKADVVAKWITDLNGSAGSHKLSIDRRIVALTILEQRALAEKKQEVLKKARVELFSLYAAKNDAGKANVYMDAILGAAKVDEKQEVARRLLDACLGPNASRVDLAGRIVETYLSGSDLGPDSPLVVAINGYITKPPAGADPNALLARVRKIEVKEPDKRQQWRNQLLQWEAFAKAQVPANVEKVSN
jgi:HEAT repeat protein